MSLKVLLSSVAFGIALVAGGYFIIAPKVSDVPEINREGERVVESNRVIGEFEAPNGTYESDEYGLTFEYSKDVDGYGLYEPVPTNEASVPLKTIVLIHHEDAPDYGEPWPVNGEDPETITVNIFENKKKQWSRQWAEANVAYSNIGLVLGEVHEVVIGGANAIRYRADGLYMSEVAVVAHGSYVYVITGTFLSEESPTYRDFEPLLASLTFIPETEKDESGDDSMDDSRTPVTTTQTEPTTPVVTPAPATTPTPTPSGYTLAQVAMHADAGSCWSAIQGDVYDLTAWVSKHPGGERNILKICGKDGTSLFEGQHGGDSKPESILAKYRLGDLI